MPKYEGTVERNAGPPLAPSTDSVPAASSCCCAVHEPELEVDDRVTLFGREWRRSLGVPGGRCVCLVGEVVVERRETRRRAEQAVVGRGLAKRLASVPHHSTQEAQVGRRQRPAEQRELGRAREAVGIVDLGQLELRAGRDADADPDQTLGEQHAVRALARLAGRDVGERRGGAVVRAKNRIGSVAPLETLAQPVRGHRPPFTGHVAADAAASVGTELAEERIAPVDEPVGADRERDAALIGRAVHLRSLRPAAIVVACGGMARLRHCQHHAGQSPPLGWSLRHRVPLQLPAKSKS